MNQQIRMTNKVSIAAVVLCLCALAGAQTIRFADITQSAGIHFTHNNGAFGKRWLPETLGPGCAFIDYDDDWYPDVLLINGTDFPGHAAHGATTPSPCCRRRICRTLPIC